MLVAAPTICTTGLCTVVSRGDVSVVGFDDLGIAETTSPRLTTVHNPVVQMVGAATSMLVDLVAGRPVRDERRVFAPRLVEGESA